MSEEQLKMFAEAIRLDAALLDKVNKAGNAEAIASIAKELGFTISPSAIRSQELSDEELEQVSGGWGGSYDNCDHCPWLE